MHFDEDDNQIMNNEKATQKEVAYPKYIQNRFVVLETHDTDQGMCASIADNELGSTQKYYVGDQLADGSIGSVEENGVVVFKPPRAEIAEFTLPSEEEMSPVGGHSASKARLKKDDELKGARKGGNAVLVISIDDGMEKATHY